MMRLRTVAALVTLSGIVPMAPASAQTNPLIVYGNDRCPANTICVRKSEGDRYRIPQALRNDASSPQNQAWASRASSVSRAGAATGIGSCSPVGAGGSIGCTQKMLKEARDERRQAANNAAGAADPDYAAQSAVTSDPR